MKRVIYIAAFTLLGLLVQQVAHAVIESWLIFLLVTDFSKYGLGLSWDTWFLIHHIVGLLLAALGGGLGFWGGVHFWKVVYIEKRHWRWRLKRA